MVDFEIQDTPSLQKTCRKTETNEMSIHQLIEDQETNKKTFLVPSYQRGYRWQRVNVSDLLNDLYEFIHSTKETYSLPIEVTFI